MFELLLHGESLLSNATLESSNRCADDKILFYWDVIEFDYLLKVLENLSDMATLILKHPQGIRDASESCCSLKVS